jgi:hypothetical protein
MKYCFFSTCTLLAVVGMLAVLGQTANAIPQSKFVYSSQKAAEAEKVSPADSTLSESWLRLNNISKEQYDTEKRKNQV